MPVPPQFTEEENKKVFIPKIKIIKKKNFKKADVNGDQALKLSHKLRERAQVYQQLGRGIIDPNFRIDDLLDLEFFERCFFGKRLHTRDQIIFKIYANELLEMIKMNLTKDIKKRYKSFVK